jgi:hypothetical protein
MEPDEACLSLIEETLLKKINHIRQFISEIPKNSRTRIFRTHVTEMLEKVKLNINNAKILRAEQFLMRSYYRNALLYLNDLNSQIEFFTIHQASVRDHRYRLFDYLISDACSRFNLKSKPLGLFGSEYYATGSFTYYWTHEITPLYQVAVDMNDPPVYWVLVAHELGHCKVSEVGLSRFEEELELRGTLEEREVYMRRIKETICDGLATCAYGYSYPAALKARLSLTGPEAYDYPSFDFRLKVAIEILKCLGYEVPGFLINFLDIDDENANREEIMPLLEDIVQFCCENVPEPLKLENNILENMTIEDVLNCGNSSVGTIFNIYWLRLAKNDISLDKASAEVLEVLKRLSAGS